MSFDSIRFAAVNKARDIILSPLSFRSSDGSLKAVPRRIGPTTQYCGPDGTIIKGPGEIAWFIDYTPHGTAKTPTSLGEAVSGFRRGVRAYEQLTQWVQRHPSADVFIGSSKTHKRMVRAAKVHGGFQEATLVTNGHTYPSDDGSAYVFATRDDVLNNSNHVRELNDRIRGRHAR